MKKMICGFVILAAMSFASCMKKKDYTCTCNVTPIGGSASTKTTTFPQTTSSDAQSKCNDYGKAAVNGNGTWNCTTK